MSIASKERLQDFASFVEDNPRLTRTQIASRQQLSPASVNRYLRACKEKELLTDIDNPAMEDDQPEIDQMIYERQKEIPRGSNKTQTGETIKVGIGDWHLSDEDVMFRSLESTVDNLVDYLHDKDYETLVFLNIGDMVSGTGIFYGQEYRNIINTSHWQTLLAAYYQKQVADRIIDTSPIEHIHFDLVKGNHDVAKKGSNLGYYLARDMQALGVDAQYRGNEFVSDNILCVHGYGMSDYRPQSPKFLRAMVKRASNLNSNGYEVDRILSGHCHWLDTDFKYTLNLAFDMVGGYQRNKRAELGRVQRPAGFIVYETGERPYEIRPNKDIFWDEANDIELEFKNVTRVGKLLKEAYRADLHHN